MSESIFSCNTDRSEAGGKELRFAPKHPEVVDPSPVFEELKVVLEEDAPAFASFCHGEMHGKYEVVRARVFEVLRSLALMATGGEILVECREEDGPCGETTAGYTLRIYPPAVPGGVWWEFVAGEPGWMAKEWLRL